MGQPQKPIASEQHILSLGRVLQSLREEDDVDVLIETTIAYLKEQFEYSLIWIALYDRLNHVLFGKGGVIPGNHTSFLQQRLVLNSGDLLEQVMIEQRPLGVADLRLEMRSVGWQEIAKKYDIQGTIILPIRYKDRCLGLVLLGSQRWGYLLNGDAKARLMMVLGELGAVLYQGEIDLQYKQTRRVDEPLLRLLENLRNLRNLDQRLEAAIKATHQFVLPTRTNIYWFEREKRYFWLRMSNQLVNMVSNSSNQQAVAGITVQELSDFYYALSVNQIVSIGDGRSSLKSDFTIKLLHRLSARSLLAAPIIWQNDLYGFLAVEGKDARIWTDADKNFVKGAAELISLVVPTEGMETTIKKVQLDAQLTSQIVQAIYSDHDLESVLHQCAILVLEQLAATRFLLLQYDPDQNKYQVFYQSQLKERRKITIAFDALNDLDWQLLQQAAVAWGIENLEKDLRLFNWHPLLLEQGVRSLLISNCAQGNAPEVLLLIATEINRSWTKQELELIQVVSQQIGVVVRQWQLHRQTEQQQKILLSFQQCLRIMEQAHSSTMSLQQLERIALEQIASHLNCPLTLLIAWYPGQNTAKIIPGVIDNSQFIIAADATISLETEPLIQWALGTDGMFTLKVNDLPKPTRKWLIGDSGQILVMALRTSVHYQPTGVVIIADSFDRQWSQQSLDATTTLICQLAWSRRWLQISSKFCLTTEELRQLNWYKHRRLEDMQRTVTMLVDQMHELDIHKNELTHVRYQQLLRQLDNTTASMTALLKLEQWQLHINWETIPLTSLLKRTLERIENLRKQRKLWIGVHGLGQQLQGDEEKSSQTDLPANASPQSLLLITGDSVKIELVLYELLVAATGRSLDAGRIDIWCRRLDEKLLEVSITDYGIINPALLTELHQDTPLDMLAPSTLDQPLGLHLAICQKLMLQLHGELHFYQLPDGRVVSRLVLPLASNNK
ncbi:GAF domain-containing sensor histidine kinase [Iningainema tapete]|uniref:GAF domain-containing protein n=1 Tax=Iningainema tapete BLCC-T55 TaxID=2748662 RepID=A0A8J7CF96_9CYAN|nr:GAF domain-containing protein [Iningainema tapete]MBD2774525.1 GAF domain-containing protein [Iningainema tapete BLCC-T55]